MPAEWQRRFVRCLEELDGAIDWRPKDGRYWVRLKAAPAEADGEPTKARDEPSSVEPPAQPKSEIFLDSEPSTNNQIIEASGQSAPDFGVSEIVTFQFTEPTPREEQWADAPS